MKNFVLIIAFSIVLNGCGLAIPTIRSERKLTRINLGMTAQDIRKKIGNPNTTRVSKQLENGQVLRVDEFQLYDSNAPLHNFGWGIVTMSFAWFFPILTPTTPYWLEYMDGKLEKWGRAGDLQPTITQDITIRDH